MSENIRAGEAAEALAIFLDFTYQTTWDDEEPSNVKTFTIISEDSQYKNQKYRLTLERIE